mgnify:CR=1 FL=1
MDRGQYAEALVENAKTYRTGELQSLLSTHGGKRITEQVVRDLLQPYVTATLPRLDTPAQEKLTSCFERFAPKAMERVRADSHMNNADQTNTVTEANTDAMLVALVNEACMPLDLALYTSDLQT